MIRTNIFIVEKSEIVGFGLLQLLKQKGFQRVFHLTQVKLLFEKLEPASLVVINPSTILESEYSLVDFERNIETFNSKAIALLSSYPNVELEKRFIQTISLNDKLNNIIEKIEKSVEKSESSDDVSNVLSEREKEVLRLIALGFSNKEIAYELNISVHTAISHRKNITAKLDVKSSSALTIYALINNIIDKEDFDKSI